MLLKHIISGERCSHFVQFNISFLFKNKKKNVSIFKRFNSFDKTYEKGKGGINSSFIYSHEKNKKNGSSSLKNTNNCQHVEETRKQFETESRSEYTCKNIEEEKDISSNASDGERVEGWEEVKNYSNEDTKYTYDDEWAKDENELNRVEHTEELEEDIDALLFTNNLNSSLIGNLWHASANSIYRESFKNVIVSKEYYKNEENSYINCDERGENYLSNETYSDKKEELNRRMEKKYSLKDNKYEINNNLKNEMNRDKNSGVHTFTQNKIENKERHKPTFNEACVLDNNKMKMNSFINEIYEEEKKEVEKMKEFFEKNEKDFMKFRNSVLCKLKISEELPKKFKHLSKDTYVFNTEKNKEEYYKKLINSLNCENNNTAYNNKKKKKNVNYDKIETIKILDIDSLPCNILNHLFAYKIVKNCSAELCLKIISRIGMYRDKYSQVSYENMINYLGQIINSNNNAEIIALFSRCYETVSIPFLVNYVRKYGTFSRSFIVNMYDKYFRKRLFDFVRYENNMGIRKIPNILTHPYHLSSYIKLLGECSAKKDMYIQLKMRGHIPNSINFNNSEKTLDNVNYIMNEASNTKIKKVNVRNDNKKLTNNKYVERPKIYDAILSAEYTGLPLEHFVDKEAKEKEEPLVNFNSQTEEQLEAECHNLVNYPNTNSLFNKIQMRDGQNVGKEKEPTEPEQVEQFYNMENIALAEGNLNDFVLEDEIREVHNYNDNNNNGNNSDHVSLIENIHYTDMEHTTDGECRENINFILDEDCDIYLYKGFNKLNKSSFKLQTKLVKEEDKNENELATYSNDHDCYEEIEQGEENKKSLWELPWKSTKKNSFFFKGRFFKILPNVGWSEIKDVSKRYIRPKRKRTKHYIRRKRVLQKKIKINLFKKKILEK
ncbi:conserved Plasmodium protein, unknown function [Plasmodium malariae]|uniref:Uncharacterized protein n=1 Tax=Plasmodium malariae TaxID=5858 RepID=A0A1A8WC84_PLAMA|nr:conserved Plasmodium protein, unknown function [Plasmodium malariae]SBS90624.1 hypothetical protein PMALA_030400 [Plasmodium malariae]SCP03412.1 conserved Plasmodium protein, unknown function [Plasmodium malariae]